MTTIDNILKFKKDNSFKFHVFSDAVRQNIEIYCS